MALQKNLKFVDLFAGIGGIRSGFVNQGFECVLSSEIDSNCQKTYLNNFGEQPFGDVCNLESSHIPSFNVLCAGFPCQPFSICGKRQGFADTRGTLFFEICRILNETKPEVVFLENVKHLLHHDSGNTLSVIISTLEELGYRTSYKLLNALEFGLPQNRERIVIIGSKNKYFDFNKIEKTKKRKPLLEFLDKIGDFEYLNENEYTLIDNPTIQSSGLVFVGYRNKGIWKKGIRPNTEHLSRVHRQPNRIYSVLGTHPTIPSQETSGRFFIYLPDSKKVRKLTLRECYRIMGFSDDFLIHQSKSEAYKQVGNSVCIPMIHSLAQAIREQLFENNKVESHEPRPKVITAV